MAMVYRPRENCRLSPKTAQIMGQRFVELAETNGELPAEMIVEDATPESSPLHPYFEWDDTEAAREYRLYQARSYRSQIEVVRVEGEPAIPLFVPVVIVPTRPRAETDIEEDEDEDDAEPGVTSIVTTMRAMADPGLWRQVLAKERRKLERIQARLRAYHQVRAIADGPLQLVIDDLSERIAEIPELAAV